MAQGAKGRSRQADPSGQSTNQSRSGHVKGTGGLGERSKPVSEALRTVAGHGRAKAELEDDLVFWMRFCPRGVSCVIKITARK
jgi:hypothetical protein